MLNGNADTVLDTQFEWSDNQLKLPTPNTVALTWNDNLYDASFHVLKTKSCINFPNLFLFLDQPNTCSCNVHWIIYIICLEMYKYIN